MITSYVSIDLETTGLNPKLDKITEIGAVKVREGKAQETFSTFVNPGRKLEERVRRLAEEFFSPEEKLFLPAKLHYAAKREQPATKPQKERLYSLLARHKITLEADVEKMTRSEADRFTDKILSVYGR